METALAVIKEGAAPVYTMGPLIHNKMALDGLKKMGAQVLRKEDVPGMPEYASVVIRAHGIPPSLEKELVNRKARIFDATCYKVKKNQLKAKELHDCGYTVFLAGEKEHGELAGISGYAAGCIIVSDPAEAEAAARSLYAMQEKNNAVFKTAILGQTTINVREYQHIAEAVMRYFADLRIERTICEATRARQEALVELCACVDAVLVAGDSDSANTRRLFDIACGYKPAWLVENVEAIPAEIKKFETVGLSAGASAPDFLIDEIEKKLLE
jgi:4-hydroxy-3-methylbut-2-enyl diphosphate reductase